ncbi:progressive ankylosis protein ANKH [Natranaerovirga pectinivora]|uniref:Progressive ankylosis protein ANKH n=1 Tax=Natranaerovirga pectinivora TaxID=682400 RepID=A0A4R3MS91_9FIRM|nr:hypothetical protein [Natranaerovirga pectinivora]TCT16298.1 progressive ankylosis protein ANKH [Natranaerovirga pectinivora]
MIISDLSKSEKESSLEKEEEVSLVEQFVFYLPLAATGFLMLLTHTLYNAGLMRLPEPEYYAAAFAVAKGLNNMFMGPINMIKQTVIALVDNKENYYIVRKFIVIMSIIASIAYLIFATTSLAPWTFKNLMEVDDDLVATSVTILKVVMLSSITITFRDFFQAIAIKFKKTYLVPLATALRIIYVLLIIIYVDQITFVSAAIIAGGMHLGATIIEALVMFLGTKLSLKNIPKQLEKLEAETGSYDAKVINTRYILAFFLPLAITSVLKMTAQPIINVGLARSIRPEIALATYLVAWGLGMNVLSPLNMFHQVPLRFLNKDNSKNYKSVKKFAIITGVLLTVIMIVMSFTNIGYYILRHWINATEEVTILSMDVLKVMCLIPAIRVGREFYWGLFMNNHMTKYIRTAKMISLISLFLAIFVTSLMNLYNVALIGVIAMIASEATEFLYLIYTYHHEKV